MLYEKGTGWWKILSPSLITPHLLLTCGTPLKHNCHIYLRLSLPNWHLLVSTNPGWLAKFKQLSRRKQRAYNHDNKASSCHRKHKQWLWDRYNTLKKKMQKARKHITLLRQQHYMPRPAVKSQAILEPYLQQALRQQWCCPPSGTQRSNLYWKYRQSKHP